MSPTERSPGPVSGDDLTCDAITADYRIVQRRRGHRFSLDDLSTAADAVRAHPRPLSCAAICVSSPRSRSAALAIC